MHTMKDGRPYTSKWCLNHAQFIKNFKGKDREEITGFYTKEFVEFMKPLILEVEEREVTEHTRNLKGKWLDVKRMGKFLVCPKCHIQIEIVE